MEYSLPPYCQYLYETAISEHDWQALSMAEWVLRTSKDLQQELKDQLELLMIDAAAYDAGTEIVAKSMAAKLRLLLYDSGSCHSLLRQTGKIDVLFYDTAQEMFPDNPFPYSGLITVGIYGPNPRYHAPLDNLPQGSGRKIPFADWWNAIVFQDNQKNQFTRRDLVRTLADQDGGAHVDAKVDKKYHNLTKQNTLGWHGRTTSGTWTALTNPHYAAIRQISHEVLRSLLPEYAPSTQATLASQDGLQMTGPIFSTQPFSSPSRSPFPPQNQTTIEKVGRNESCPCGSGKKNKKCHGW